VISNKSKSTDPEGFQALPPTYFLTCHHRFVVFHAYIRTVANARLLLVAQLTVCCSVYKCFFLPSAFCIFTAHVEGAYEDQVDTPTRRDPKTEQTMDLPQTSMCDRCSQVGWKDLNSGTILCLFVTRAFRLFNIGTVSTHPIHLNHWICNKIRFKRIFLLLLVYFWQGIAEPLALICVARNERSKLPEAPICVGGSAFCIRYSV
jgi:hypothetical protein